MAYPTNGFHRNPISSFATRKPRINRLALGYEHIRYDGDPCIPQSNQTVATVSGRGIESAHDDASDARIDNRQRASASPALRRTWLKRHVKRRAWLWSPTQIGQSIPLRMSATIHFEISTGDNRSILDDHRTHSRIGTRLGNVALQGLMNRLSHKSFVLFQI